MLLRNKFLAILILATSTYANALIQKNVALSYHSGGVTYDYSEARWKDKVSGVDVYACANARDKVQPVDPCVLMENRQANKESSGSISGAGLYLAYFVSSDKEDFFGNTIKKKVLYAQYIAIMEEPNSHVATLAQKFSPVFSFHELESYYPVSLNQIFNRRSSDYDLEYLSDVQSRIGNEDLMSDIMSAYGATQNRIKLKTSLAKEIGRKSSGSPVPNFPVYWFHQTEGDNLWITYFVLYAFDEKRNEYLQGESGADLGSHSIDRESITVKFVKSGASYMPSQVVYAGHLPAQPTTFLGCVFDCLVPGDLTPRWLGGKTTVDWSNTSRMGDNPIVYVARGSHASKPAHGWYFLETGWTGFISNVTEPAGNSVADNLVSGALTAVDFEKSEFQPLTYSGFIIKGADDWYRIFPFVRFPVDKWAGTSNKVFNDCVANRQGCEKYINQPLPQFSVIATPLFSRYTSDSGEQCYDREIGTARSTGVYTLSRTSYCLRNGQWIDATGVDHELFLDSQGHLYPFSSIEIRSTGNSTYTAGYGGSTIWNLEYTQISAGVYSRSFRSVASSYSVHYDPNSYIYQNTDNFPLLIGKYNAGTPYTGYLSSGGEIGFLFASHPLATEGFAYYFRIDDPDRSTVDTGTWLKKSFGSTVQIIELDEKSSMLGDGDRYMRKIYYKNSSESGVREGNMTLAGRTRTEEKFERTAFNANLARDGLPATPN